MRISDLLSVISGLFGRGRYIQTAAGSEYTAGNLLSYDNSGAAKDSGIATAGVGSGTVTHTSGALTNNQIILGAGAADIKVGNLSGDVTTSGSGATALANIPSATPMAGSLLATAIAAPSTPAAGKGSIYVDSTSKNVAVKDDAGVIKHGVQTKTAVSNSFATAIDDAGAVTVAQPTEANLSLSDITTNDVTSSAHGLVPKSPGDATKFLNGAATPAWAVPAGGSAGALVLLEQHTASASATLDFTTAISATYDEYEIHFVGIVPATTNVSFQMQMGTGAGPTYDTGNNYNYGMLYSGIGDVPTQSSGSSVGAIDLAHSVSTTTSYSTNGVIYLFNPGGSAFKFINGKIQSVAVGNLYQWGNSGVYKSTTAVTAFRFLMSSGNITSGIIRVYGVAKS